MGKEIDGIAQPEQPQRHQPRQDVVAQAGHCGNQGKPGHDQKNYIFFEGRFELDVVQSNEDHQHAKRADIKPDIRPHGLTSAFRRQDDPYPNW